MSQEPLNFIIAHPNAETIAQIRSVVEKSHNVVFECTTAKSLKDAAIRIWPDMIITGISYPDGDGLDVVIELGDKNPLPSVVVTTSRSLAMVEKAMQDHVMAYLIEPVRSDELEAAIVLARGRFEQLSELASEVENLRQALDDRKLIERAKGILMAEHGLDEAEAFAKLRTSAQNKRIKLVDAARRLLEEQTDSDSVG